MGRALGYIYKGADLRLVRLVTDSYFHLPFKDRESLGLIMVDVRGVDRHQVVPVLLTRCNPRRFLLNSRE